MKVEKIPCQKCFEGRAWITLEQIETGDTTKKGKWVICPCCKGINWRACAKCTIEELQKESE